MGFDIIGMTNLQEAKLAREAEIAYASLSMVTDYDCWREEEEHVTGEGVMEVLRKNVALAQRVVRRAIGALGPEVANDCADRPGDVADHRPRPGAGRHPARRSSRSSASTSTAPAESSPGGAEPHPRAGTSVR